MRKFLLAGVAALAAAAVPAPPAAAQTAGYDDGQSAPSQGQVTVRLNGRFRFYADVMPTDSARTSNFAAPAAAATTAIGSATGNTSNAGFNRLDNYGFQDYVRLYPGFDGIAANGLRYGASIEIRQENNFGSGNGVYGPAGAQVRFQGGLYVQREWGYLGADRYGTLRFGSTDDPNSLYLTGTLENFDAGGLNGDLPFALPGAVQVTWPFADANFNANSYSSDKAVYLSPQYDGFDFGASFEPSTSTTGGINAGDCGPTAAPGQYIASGNSVATPGCAALSSTSTGDYTRRRDTYEALLRYRGVFEGVYGVAATASYQGSGRVHDSGIAGSAADPKHFPEDDLSVADFGLAVTYAGVVVGANYQFGRYGGQGGAYGDLISKGQPNSSALLLGASYTVGPLVFGAHYLRSFTEGDNQTATSRSLLGAPYTGPVIGGQRFEEGAAAGGTYALAPGVATYLSYAWGQRRQNGFDFLNDVSNSPNNNKVDSSVLGVGTSFSW